MEYDENESNSLLDNCRSRCKHARVGELIILQEAVNSELRDRGYKNG